MLKKNILDSNLIFIVLIEQWKPRFLLNEYRCLNIISSSNEKNLLETTFD